MKHMFLLVVLVGMVATQFSIPDISAVGQAIKNGVVEAEQKVENLAKEEIQNAGNLIHQGVEKISHLVDSAPNAPAPQPVQAPKEKTQYQPKPTVINTEFAVFVPVSAEVVITAEPPKTETKPVEPQSSAVQQSKVPEVTAKPNESIVTVPLEKAPREHRKGPKHGHKERKEEASSDSDSDSSEDIEERRHKEERKDRKDRKDRKRHDHSGQDMKQRREERERRIKQKQEHMKKYEKKHAQKHSEDKLQLVQRNPMKQEQRGRMNGIDNPYGNIKIEALNERVKLVMP